MSQLDAIRLTLAITKTEELTMLEMESLYDQLTKEREI